MIKLIRVHLIPNGGEKTWEPKGTKHVQMLGLEDKRQVIMLVSSNVVGNLFPPWTMFTCSTPRTLPPNSNGNGWDLIFNENDSLVIR
jgi:hypothetical protein